MKINILACGGVSKELHFEIVADNGNIFYYRVFLAYYVSGADNLVAIGIAKNEPAYVRKSAAIFCTKVQDILGNVEILRHNIAGSGGLNLYKQDLMFSSLRYKKYGNIGLLVKYANNILSSNVGWHSDALKCKAV